MRPISKTFPLLAVLLGFLAVAAPPAPAGFAAAFNDTAAHWSDASVAWAVRQGIVDGYDDRTFRPDARVSEPEFLAMLLRANPQKEPAHGANAADSPWYAAYYAFAAEQRWPVLNDPDRTRFNRGRAALILAASQQGTLPLTDSIRYLLDNGLSQGKTAATVEGYRAGDGLTRAEAVQFIRNLKERNFTLVPGDRGAAGAEPPAAAVNGAAVSAEGVGIGESAADVRARLGEPDRIDASEYGFQWYVYNRDYTDYVQIGIDGNRVAALYSPAANWSTSAGIRDGASRSDVTSAYGEPLAFITKGNTRFMQNYGDDEYATFLIDGIYMTFFYDHFDGGKVVGMQAVAQTTEHALASFYADGSPELTAAFERETFDLANVARVRRGLAAFEWDETAAQTARKHSRNMAELGFFDHVNPASETPFDRMEAQGIRYRAAAENIAAGQTSAIFAHHGWMNSAGHRQNILADIRRLGTGAAFGGEMHVYYTQNFFTAR